MRLLKKQLQEFGYIVNVPKFLQLFDTLMVSGDAANVGQSHNIFSCNGNRINIIILGP